MARGYAASGTSRTAKASIAEMVGLGLANLAPAFFQGFPISSSPSRTPVAEAAGARTQLTGVVGAVAIALLLLFAPATKRRSCGTDADAQPALRSNPNFVAIATCWRTGARASPRRVSLVNGRRGRPEGKRKQGRSQHDSLHEFKGFEMIQRLAGCYNPLAWGKTVSMFAPTM